MRLVALKGESSEVKAESSKVSSNTDNYSKVKKEDSLTKDKTAKIKESSPKSPWSCDHLVATLHSRHERNQETGQ